jgi:hypothetical protein
MKSKQFQRPRGRYFFHYLFKFRPAFLIQFLKFVWSFPAEFQSKNVDPSHIPGSVELNIQIGLLERENSE